MEEGSQLTIEQAIANLTGVDIAMRLYSAWWLGRFRVASPEAVDGLIVALEDCDDRTEFGGYPLRRNAARALGKLADRRAVPALMNALGCSDFYVREAASQALETLGDPICVDTLIALLKNEIEGTVPATEPPQLVQPFDAILEALGTLGATDALPLIFPFCDHEVPRVRFAAARACYQLTSNPHEANVFGQRLVEGLALDDLQLRRTVLADLGAIGYLPAAHPIAETLAENSLKLIALKGLLEKQLSMFPKDNNFTEFSLSQGAIVVMDLMDNLL